MHVGVGAVAHVRDDFYGFAEVIVVAAFITTIEKDSRARRRLGGGLDGFLEGHEQDG